LKEFTYKGNSYTGCTTADHVGGGWCSQDSEFHTGGQWHRCTWDCSNPNTCSWKKQEACLDKFSYESQEFEGCTKYKFSAAWCSMTPQHETGTDNWRRCEWNCPCYWKPKWDCVPEFSYKGQKYNGCATVDHAGQGWCSHDAMFNGKWSKCSNFCPQDTDGFADIPKPSALSGTNCAWKPASTCVPQWQYNGSPVTGCTQLDHIGQWCSTETVFTGSAAPNQSGTPNTNWKHCNWECDTPVPCGNTLAPGCQAEFKVQGASFSGCRPADDNHDRGWCSLTKEYVSDWKACGWECPCYWQRDPECVEEWYSADDSKPIKGCAAAGKDAWCSTSAVFNGQYRWCSWNCAKDQNNTIQLGRMTPAGTGGTVWGAARPSMLPNSAAQMAALQGMGAQRKVSVRQASVAPVAAHSSMPMGLVVGSAIFSLCILFVVGARVSSKRPRQARCRNQPYLAVNEADVDEEHGENLLQ
jgi:hypothetical protein